MLKLSRTRSMIQLASSQSVAADGTAELCYLDVMYGAQRRNLLLSKDVRFLLP